MTRTRPNRRVGGSRGRFGSAGFTLVELLVVIGIIALLVAILVPSVRQAAEMAKAVACQHNLWQLYEAFHVSTDSKLSFPAPAQWVQFAQARGCTGLTICPADDAAAGGSPEDALEDAYLVQVDPKTYFYPLMNCIRGSKGGHQFELIHRSEDVKEIWLGNYRNTTVLAQSDADGALRVTLSTAYVEALDAPGQYSCHSDHWVCVGSGMGTADWQQDIKMRLTGNNYHKIEDPIYLTGAVGASYGMNVAFKPIDTTPDKLLLLDYKKTVARPVEDTVGSDWKHLAPRHLGRVNAVFGDGAVKRLWPWEVAPTEPLWGL